MLGGLASVAKRKRRNAAPTRERATTDETAIAACSNALVATGTTSKPWGKRGGRKKETIA